MDTKPGLLLVLLGRSISSYAGQNVALEIQSTMPSTPDKPSKGPMIIGYWTFGNSVENDILISLEKPKWLIAMANMFVVIHLIGSYY